MTELEQLRLRQLSKLRLPFGKFKGEYLTDVPLRYLDMTVSTMPPTWITRRVQEFVDIVMATELTDDEVPEFSFGELCCEWMESHVS